MKTNEIKKTAIITGKDTILADTDAEGTRRV